MPEGGSRVRLAVLDVGSNTVHLVVVDGRPDGTFAPVSRDRDTLRLAEWALARARSHQRTRPESWDAVEGTEDPA